MGLRSNEPDDGRYMPPDGMKPSNPIPDMPVSSNPDEG